MRYDMLSHGSDVQRQQQLEHLKTLSQEEGSFVTTTRSTLTMPLLPSKSGHEIDSISESLQQKTFSYMPQLKGFLLDFNDVKLDSEYGKVIADLPHILWNVSADFFVFKPVIGSLIQGTISRFGEVDDRSVTCLVYDLFPASVSLPDENSSVTSRHIKLGRKIMFEITKIDPSKNTLFGIFNDECIKRMSMK